MFDVLMDGDSLNAEILHSISPSDRFTRFLPLYSIQAACGYFDEYEEPEAEGWVDGCIFITFHSEQGNVRGSCQGQLDAAEN